MSEDGPKPPPAPTPRGPRNEMSIAKVLVGAVAFVVAYVVVKYLTASLFGHH